MLKYKLYGDKVQQYYTVVTADSPGHALDFAADNDNLDWIQIEDDSAIEVHDVEQVEDTIDLLEDGYPSMANEILIMDKSDK